MRRCSSSNLRRRRVQPVVLCGIVVAATITQSLAFQHKSAVNAANPSTIEDFKAGDANREPHQRATDLLAALEVSQGDLVADVRAGAGYYSMRLSEIVGPNGKVFAEDISNSAMGWLSARVRAFNLPNFEIVKGESKDPRLPIDRLAAILIVDSYHHFTDYPAMLGKMLHALKPGGRLTIADYSFVEHRSQPRADQVKVHEIDPGLVREEIARVGFVVSRCEDPFVKWVPGVGNTRAIAADMFLMIAIRPK